MKKPFLSSGSVMKARNFEGRTSRFFSSIAWVSSPTSTGMTFYLALFQPTDSHFAPLHRTKKRLIESAVADKIITRVPQSKKNWDAPQGAPTPPTLHIRNTTGDWGPAHPTPHIWCFLNMPPE